MTLPYCYWNLSLRFDSLLGDLSIIRSLLESRVGCGKGEAEVSPRQEWGEDSRKRREDAGLKMGFVCVSVLGPAQAHLPMLLTPHDFLSFQL